MAAFPPALGAVLALAACGCTGALAAPTIASSPSVPGYGDAVSVQLEGTSAPVYLPATRYSREGSTITIDYEYLQDGFGPRLDFGYPDVDLGELPPGNYRMQARLFDIARPDAAPQVLTASLPVVPPDALGIYPVPWRPAAFGAVQAMVRSAVYFDPSTLRASVSGSTIRVDFDYDEAAPVGGPAPAGMSAFGAVRVGALAPGAYRLEGWGRKMSGGDYERYFTKDFVVGGAAHVIEYYEPALDHYFMAAAPDEIALVDAGARGGWMRTGEHFDAWLRHQDAPAGAQPVCRFYAAGPNSHFYTGDAAECAGLEALERAQRADAQARGEPFLGWGYEGIAFWALVPRDGTCPAGTDPVYREYNGRAAADDSNHRFTSNALMRQAMGMEWVDEGVAFCSPRAS